MNETKKKRVERMEKKHQQCSVLIEKLNLSLFLPLYFYLLLLSLSPSLSLTHTHTIINLPTQGYEMRLIDRATDESV